MPDPASARLGIVAPDLSDPADLPAFAAHIRDRLEAMAVTLDDRRLDAVIPVGAGMIWYGAGDLALPNGAEFLLPDGRLIDKTVYAAFFTAVGNIYNGGVDPGSNKVRIPDERGRTGVTPDDLGTGAGAAGRLPSTPSNRGRSIGAELTALTAAQLPAHPHVVTDPGHVHTFLPPQQTGGSDVVVGDFSGAAADQIGYAAKSPYNNPTLLSTLAGMTWTASAHVTGVTVAGGGSGGSSGAGHSNMQPGLARAVLVRVA